MKQVYFIKPIGMDGPVKIGCTAQIRTRLVAINDWVPFPLEVAATIDGDMRLERRFHAMFAPSRIHGEWFAHSAHLAETIARIRAGTFDKNDVPAAGIQRIAADGDGGPVFTGRVTLNEILSFCRRYGMSSSTFGREVANDPALISGMRHGRAPRQKMEARIHAFMAAYNAPSAAPVARA